MNLAGLQRLAHWLYIRKLKLPSKCIYYLQFLLFNSSVPPKATIGAGTVFAYGGIGCVIHENSVIGTNCIIGQGITIGGRSKIEQVPTIGNDVYLGAGCRVLGPVVIGNDVVIGPNSVVLHDVPSGSIVVGIPARITKSGIKMRDFV